MTFNNPKRKKALYHRLTTASGHILSIGWDFGRQKYCVSVYHPEKAKDPESWYPETKFFGDTPREVLSGARRMIAEEINPDIKRVRERVTGKDDGVLTVDRLRQAQKTLALGLNYGMRNPKIFLNSKQQQILKDNLEIADKAMGGLLGIDIRTIIHDELDEIDATFWDQKSDLNDSIAYLLSTSFSLKIK